MLETDFGEANSVFRVAFGTFVGMPEPKNFAADQDYIVARWHADPAAWRVAEVDGKLVGSNFGSNWGSFAFFGPLTVRPELWNQGIAQSLVASTVEMFESWGVRDAGLFTFSNSPKHVALYQKFGFWPRFLTALMSKPVTANVLGSGLHFSTLSDKRQGEALATCRNLTDSIYPGLDVSLEIRSVLKQKLGETVLLWGGDKLDAFAVCHCGAGTEAGAGKCYLKFAAVRPATASETLFRQLLDACEALAAARNLTRLEAGMNLGRAQAYRSLLRRGFRSGMLGVAMHKPDTAAYNREDVFVVDDWR